MSGAGDQARTTTAGAATLALLLVLGAGAAAWWDRPGDPAPTPSPTPSQPPSPSPSPSASATVRPEPSPGAAYPLQRLGALTDRSRIVPGRGGAELRFARAPGNGTRLHFICTGCDAGTRVVARPGGAVGGPGPLADPSATTDALVPTAPGRSTSLLVDAPPGAEWAVTLTPFDQVPLHEVTFDGLGDDVVAVRARADLTLGCGGPASVQTLARPAGEAEYAPVGTRRAPAAGTTVLPPVPGTDRVVLVVRCPGRWTLTLP